MKKKVISLIGVIIMLLNVVCPMAFAEDEVVIENSFPVADNIGSGKYASSKSLGFDVLENEKYLLIAEGTHQTAFANVDIHVNDKIHIYEKPNNEHLDYKFLTTIKVDSNNANYDVPARDIHLYGDTLFVFWGNALYAKNAAGYYPSGTGSADPKSWLFSYDLSDIEAGETLTGTPVTSGDPRAVKHVPFTRGGISYIDENGMLYASRIVNGTYDYKEYNIRDASDPTKSLLTFRTDAQSKNAVQFVVKDDYLYEVLQQEAGNADQNSAATLVDADGNAINNTVAIYYINSKYDASGKLTVAPSKKATYTTETAGDYTMQDIDVRGDYVYIATTNGLEIINTAAVKGATSLQKLSLGKRILEDVNVKGISIFENELYVGTDSEMQIYNISAGIPALKAAYTLEGGFCDFEVNKEENAIYAMRNANKGVVVIDKAMLDLSLNVEGFEFDSEKAGFSAEVSSEASASVKSVLMMYKGNKLVDMSIKEWSVSESAITVSDSIEKTIEGAVVKVMFVTAADETKVIPMVTEEGTEYKKEYGEGASVTGVYDSSVTVSDIGYDGVITISGNIKDRASKPILVSVKNSNTDRLDGYSYFDVLDVAEGGNYETSFKPADSGDYTVTVSRIGSVGKSEVSDITVPALEVSVPGAVEIPGVEAPLAINAEYAQNVETLDVELTFDGDALSMSEEVTVSEQFELKSAKASKGSLKLSLTKKADIKTSSFEFGIISVNIANSANYGDYNIALKVTAKDEFGVELLAETVDGNIELVVSTPKYDAMDAAKAALAKLIDAESIDVENYLDEKAKITDARAKVEIAYEYLVRDSQLGEELVSNLLASEEKLTEIKPYYDAVDALNAAEKEKVISALKDNKTYFSLTDKEFEVYDEVAASETLSTDSIDTAVADATFIKPSDVKKVFAEKVVLEAFKETTWQNVDTLLGILSEAKVLDISAYEGLTYDQKTEVHQDMALRTYENAEKIKEALKTAVDDAKGSGGGGSSGGGSTSSKPSRPSIYVPPAVTEKPDVVTPEVPVTPVTPVVPDDGDKAIFDDIKDYDWAKEAITSLYDKGIINGKEAGKFAPSDSVKREEFAKMVVLAFDIMVVPTEYDFSDVDENAWYEDYVYALASAGIVNGREDGTFGVGDYITRQEIAVILERIADYKKAEFTAEETKFSDSNDISSWAESAMKKMYGSGILSGFEDNTVRPNENASRAQIAKIVYSTLAFFK